MDKGNGWIYAGVIGILVGAFFIIFNKMFPAILFGVVGCLCFGVPEGEENG